MQAVFQTYKRNEIKTALMKGILSLNLCCPCNNTCPIKIKSWKSSYTFYLSGQIQQSIIFCNDHYIFSLSWTTLNLLWDVAKIRRQDVGRIFLFWRRVSSPESAREINILLKNSRWKKNNVVKFSSCWAGLIFSLTCLVSFF